MLLSLRSHHPRKENVKTKVFQVIVMIEDNPGVDAAGCPMPYLTKAEIEKALRVDLPAGTLCTHVEVHHVGWCEEAQKPPTAQPSVRKQGKLLRLHRRG